MPIDISRSIEACAAHYGEDADAVRNYMIEGERKARALDNRGPIKFDEDGNLDPTILEAYSKYGFYVFEGVISDQEIADIKDDIAQMRKRFPTDSTSKVTATGEPAMNADCQHANLLWAKPLGDPLGGTPVANGRHQVKLFEPEAAANAPKETPFVLLGSLQFSEACLRLYAHPQLLKVAETINGEDFAPFNETIFFKDAGVGAAVSWHQDGDTHWDSDKFDQDIHGFNFMGQVYGSTAVNGVWVVPGSHKKGRVDITKAVAEAGSERILDAVPIVCDPGDVVINNRQILHGSFANTGFEPRLTINFGFHRRSSVLGVMGAGIHSDAVVYNDQFIRERSRVIGYGINARAKKYPHETPYVYKPLADVQHEYEWTEQAKAGLRDYNAQDLSI